MSFACQLSPITSFPLSLSGKILDRLFNTLQYPEILLGILCQELVPHPMPVVLPFCNFNHGHLLNSCGLIFNLSNLCNMEVFRSDFHSFLLSVFTLHFYYSETHTSEKITFRSICFIYSLSHPFLIRLKTTRLACIFLDMFILFSR